MMLMDLKFGKVEIIGVALLTVLRCFDYITTHFALSAGAVELNPFTRPLWDVGILSVLLYEAPFYILLALVLVVASGAIRWISKEDVRLTRAHYSIWLVVLSLYSLPIFNNLSVLFL